MLFSFGVRVDSVCGVEKLVWVLVLVDEVVEGG